MTVALPASPPRDRFVAFAFAGADLLVETNVGGTIGFAVGAFRARLGAEPDAFVGRDVTELVAPDDRVPLAIAVASIASRGRIAPMVLRLNDTLRTPTNVSGMLVPGPPARLCFTLGPVPIQPVAPPSGATLARSFAREAESHLRGGGGELSLVEVTGWQAVREAMSAAEQRALRGEIQAAIGADTPGVMAGELADGRFGIMSPGAADLKGIVQRLEKLLRASPVTRHARVDGAKVPLVAGAMNASQAVRALRYALLQFADGGADAARAAGSAGGLEGIIAQTEVRARGLREVIAERRFRLNFQPVVSLANRGVHHYEALLRPYTSLNNAIRNTQDFIVFTEAVGLADELDCAVADMALAAMRASPGVSVAVNVSGLSMQSEAFPARFLDLLATGGPLPGPGRLLIELTETAEIDAMAIAAANIVQIRAAGVPVCIDDFGAGAAALSYLREFKVDYVKIDGLYVQRATLGPRERGFVASMVEMANGAGARVVAEMVETEEQAALLRSLGAEFGQGWLFGRPGLLPGSGF
jgi:EAL domain-containing protein (putative c-di-GMP-specific phosphodiesterase class I)